MSVSEKSEHDKSFINNSSEYLLLSKNKCCVNYTRYIDFII